MVTSTYNYLASSYQSTRPIRYTSHKTSELRRIYNSIVNISKQSPLYLINTTLESQTYALNIKDAAMSLHTLLNNFSNNKASSIFDEKKAISSDEESVIASITSKKEPALPTELSIQVDTLAKTQKNISNRFQPDSCKLESGKYEYSIDTEGSIYNFSLEILKDDTNRNVISKLCKQINSSKIGVHASSLADEESGQLRVVLESSSTGNTGSPLFTLQDDVYIGGRGLVEYLHLDKIYQNAENAHFKINGKDKESLSNHFTFNKSLTINMLKPSKEPISISYAPNADLIVKELGTIIDSYNQLISLANSHSKQQRRANKLLHELDSAYYNYKNDLESCGINRSDNGELTIDSFTTLQAAADGTIKELFTDPHKISKDLLTQTKEIMLNPMDYLDQKICTYPNYGTLPYPNPYQTSAYSGMLFNYYC